MLAPGHGPGPDLAVTGARPYLRPLLAALQRNPPYQVAVLDARQAWVLGIDDDAIDTLAQRTGPGVPSTGFAGWYGLEAYRMQQRAIQQARQHYRDTAGILEDSAKPLVIGGHEMQISQFLTIMPPSVRQRIAGTFSLDLRTATPARVRELASPVIASWAESTEAQLVSEVLSEPPGSSVTTSLADCVTAVRARAVSQLVLADDEVVPGSACDACGALAIGGIGAIGETTGCDCADAGFRPVPDLLDELTSQALDGGSEVSAVRQAPFAAAARLRFPLTETGPVPRPAPVPAPRSPG